LPDAFGRSAVPRLTGEIYSGRGRRYETIEIRIILENFKVFFYFLTFQEFTIPAEAINRLNKKQQGIGTTKGGRKEKWT